MSGKFQIESIPQDVYDQMGEQLHSILLLLNIYNLML